MTVLELFVPQNGVPWINANDRSHWSKRARYTKGWRRMGWAYAAQHRLPKNLTRVKVDVDVIKTRANRYDPANLHPTAKATIDGLVDYGLIPDDDHTHLDGPHLHHGGTSPTPGLHLRIEVL